jgi:hypothetical protein
MMSSSSDALPEWPWGPGDGKPGGAVALLAAVSAEVASIAGEITVLGDRLADCAEGDPATPSTDMQMFDLISQNAQAQARLLAELVRCIAGGDEAETGPLRMAIDAVPFHNTRQRLYAALDGAAVPPAGSPSDEGCHDTDWF